MSLLNQSTPNYQSINTMAANSNNNTNNVENNTEGNQLTIINYFASRLIPNVGSTARDHLANERTFLAWLRTSLALVTMGIAISQLNAFSQNPDPENKTAITIGSVYIAIGMLFIVVGVSRYFYIQNMLINNMFPAARYTVLLGVALLGLVIGTLLVTIFLDIA